MLAGFFVDGGAAAEGWTSYPPLSEAAYSGTGTDLWLMAVSAHRHELDPRRRSTSW